MARYTYELVQPCPALEYPAFFDFIHNSLFRKGVLLDRIRKPRVHWANIENRRNYLCAYAHEMGFDPYSRESWNGVTKQHIIARRQVKTVVILVGLAKLACCRVRVRFGIFMVPSRRSLPILFLLEFNNVQRYPPPLLLSVSSSAKAHTLEALT